MPRNIHPYEVILAAMMTLQKENAELKKNASNIRIQNIAKEVAVQVDEWLDKPYEDKKTKQQDIKDFALQITRYIDHKLHD